MVVLVTTPGTYLSSCFHKDLLWWVPNNAGGSDSSSLAFPWKQQSYSPLRIPFSTMGREVSPRSHLMSSQLMVASMASLTYTASPLSSPKSFPEGNSRSLLEKFFNLKWQKTQKDSLRKICCCHAWSQMPAFSIPELKLCCNAGQEQNQLVPACQIPVLSEPEPWADKVFDNQHKHWIFNVSCNQSLSIFLWWFCDNIGTSFSGPRK